MTTKTLLFVATALCSTATLPLTSAARQAGKPAKTAPQPPPAVKLTTTEFPDGTGTIGLPAGWSIEGSYRGTVGCNGPNSQRALLGMAFVIGRPDHPNNNLGIPYSGPMGRDGDLAGALKADLEKNGTRLISLRKRELPSPAPGVPAALFLYEMESRGKHMVALGYFSAIIDPTQTLGYWELYSSAVMAPKETFIKEFDTLMAVYSSYRPNGKAPREGSDGARLDEAIAANLKARRETLKSQQEAFDRMNERFKSVIQQ